MHYSNSWLLTHLSWCYLTFKSPAVPELWPFSFMYCISWYKLSWYSFSVNTGMLPVCTSLCTLSVSCSGSLGPQYASCWHLGTLFCPLCVLLFLVSVSSFWFYHTTVGHSCGSCLRKNVWELKLKKERENITVLKIFSILSLRFGGCNQIRKSFPAQLKVLLLCCNWIDLRISSHCKPWLLVWPVVNYFFPLWKVLGFFPIWIFYLVSLKISW